MRRTAGLARFERRAQSRQVNSRRVADRRQLWSIGLGAAAILIATSMPLLNWSAANGTTRFGTAAAQADDELAKRASWAPPSVEQTRGELDKWLATTKIDDAVKAKIAALWPAASEQIEAPELLDRTIDTIALVLPAIQDVAATCRQPLVGASPPQFPQLSDSTLAPMVRNNLRLYVGRWLAQHSFYDEALEQLDGLNPADVVDPASLLFYQSVSHHRLLNKDKCLPAISRLMENEKAIPKRYLTLAKLMDADLRPLKADSLDEVARLMDDIRRRLDFGRAGTKVRKEEDDVIAKLDKMIEELEKQQQQQQQQQGSGGGSSPSSPKADSTPGGMKGPGNVDPKNVGNGRDWGNLPPKERQEALQQISKDLPAHYREAIEEYFRKLARDGIKK